ncbi:MAG TPA: NnrS family protein [Povalibacter sp.]|uniref:NnrS family protein n=1 Tax=Povalibacter sp. TaxID=1962978 RepID=UPI002C17820B|nr:NnrS family protein [Povalibacter sp.]HMN46266.1 NnrS family protein [Povalibacter sp.]
MPTPPLILNPPAAALRLLAAAPHRLMFFIGATNVLLAMTWWTLWLLDTRWHLFGLAQPAVPAGWLHAMLMQYQVLPSFMFGFLLTVFPRWMNLPALDRSRYIPVGIGMFGGQLLTLVGLFAGLPLLKAGAILTLLGWSIGTFLLARLVYQDRGRTWHAVSCLAALGFGLLGLVAWLGFLQSSDAKLLFLAVKVGSIAVLLPIFFTVCHRMIAFFASGVIAGYQPQRPMWALATFWPLALLHVWFELRHAYGWLWIADVPMTILTGWLLVRWWPRGASMPGLLRVLFVGFAWLPIAFALYSAQSLWFATTGAFELGRGPAHALFIGYFSSLLVAMVTRVTQGHSGRPLVLGRVAAFAFVLVQLIAVSRVVAEIVPDSLAWHALAAVEWIIAFLPWVLRSTWIYLTPRADGREG